MSPKVSKTDIATRSMIVAFKSPIGGYSSMRLQEITGVPKRTIDSIYARAIERGFDPNQSPLVIKNEFVEEAPRSGRPTNQTEEVKELITANVRRDPYDREQTIADLP